MKLFKMKIQNGSGLTKSFYDFYIIAESFSAIEGKLKTLLKSGDDMITKIDLICGEATICKTDTAFRKGCLSLHESKNPGLIIVPEEK